jgi:tRNA threonylcarbamoyladenosine biosynthesis protein TsaB
VILAALDTATSSTVAAARLGDGRLFEARDDPPPGARPNHASRALALLEQALAAAGIGWADVGRLAVGVGPGGFTGLRIGIATARGLAQAHGLELAPVSSLRALAAGRDVAAAIDARRGEVYAWSAHLPAAAYAPEELARRVRGGTVVGDGAVAYRELFEAAGCTVEPAMIGGAALCELGAAAAPVARDALLPDYRREPDAVPPSLP